ncbi:cytochrome P450 [Streptomyces sp. NPDC057638]|uniref:cytochrome P450 family protein n=1 Tax=Streptomyces sp. NPDC057638 TaxID=3346190 RepID=UPI00367763FC
MTLSAPVAIDPFGTDFPAEIARLRERGAIVPIVLPGGIPAWAPTGYQPLKTLLLDDRVSKDARQHWSRLAEAEQRPEWQWIITWVGVTNMLATYGVEHMRLRRLVSPSFTARRTQMMRPRVERITRALLDELAVTDGRVDLKAGYAHPLPMRVICELAGVPDHLQEGMRDLIAALMNTSDASPEQAAWKLEQIATLPPRLVEHRRAHPGDDLTTELIRVRDEDGDRLSDRELSDTLLLIVGAGFETTVNLIGNAVVTLLRHPDQLAAVRAGEVTWEAVIEEVMRVNPSIANLPLRFAVSDIELDGVTIPAGDAILTTYAAAGRDTDRYGADAFAFDITRDAEDHLSFGIGVHRCIGAPLARMEAATALPALFARFPEMELAGELEQVPSFIAEGWQKIPVRLWR